MKKYGRLVDACERYSLKPTRMRNLSREHGAVVKIGRAVFYDFDILDSVFESHRTGGHK